ncbi:MAG: PKD domain-containing protein, partial [Dehalococcoidia bacterium]|nr:PKD domain-containing protein [Dehalococcoidia bacterium]
MNTKVVRALSRAFSTIMVASLLVLSLGVPLVSAADGDIYTGNITLQSTGTQTVQVRIDVTDLGSCQAELHFDNTVIDVVSVAAGNIPTAPAVSGGVYTGPVDQVTYVSCAYLNTASAGNGPSGNFVFFSVTFRALKAATATSFTLENLVGAKTGGAGITFTPAAGTYTVLSPTEVWVDDDWAGSSDGDAVNGYTFGYNAFCTIQEGVDAVSGSTVHVLEGEYDGFTIDYTNGLDVLGEDGAVVNGISVPGLPGVDEVLCFINECSNVLVQNLEFDGDAFVDGTLYNGGADAAVACFGCTDTTLEELTIYDCNDNLPGLTYGIYVSGGLAQTVDVVAPAISACEVGIYVTKDSLNVTGGSIQGGGTEASYNSTGILVDGFSIANVEGTEIFDCANVGALEAPERRASSNPAGCGIYVEQNASAYVYGCCDIHHNDVGIFVQSFEPLNPQPGEPGEGTSGWLEANGNSIYDNRVWGVFYSLGYRGTVDHDPGIILFPSLNCEENWWGDEQGPTVMPLTGEEAELTPVGIKGDWVTYGVDYTPWLDGPCPYGDPVGLNAKLKGVARSGEPGLEVQFTDLSTPAPGCEIEEWLWDFGDRGTSSAQNPSHVYTREGSYTVTLTVVDSCGFKDSITMRAYISIKTTGGEELEPADMVVSYLLIDPLQVLPGQEVLVSGNICNQGEERGSKTVSLMVNGV